MEEVLKRKQEQDELNEKSLTEAKLENSNVRQQLEAVSIEKIDIEKRLVDIEALLTGNMDEIERLRDENRQLKAKIDNFESNENRFQMTQRKRECEINELKTKLAAKLRCELQMADMSEKLEAQVTLSSHVKTILNLLFQTREIEILKDQLNGKTERLSEHFKRKRFILQTIDENNNKISNDDQMLKLNEAFIEPKRAPIKRDSSTPINDRATPKLPDLNISTITNEPITQSVNKKRKPLKY